MIPKIAVCIPTYKRAHLLRLLIDDLTLQTLQPTHLIVVDGDPSSGDVVKMLNEFPAPKKWRVTYIPSNYGNLSYQRYLGWRVASQTGAEILSYFDDDERLLQRDVLEKLAALFEDPQVVGVGAHIRFPEQNEINTAPKLSFGKERTGWNRWLSSERRRKLKPGDLTPSGHRIPIEDDGSELVNTHWLRGGSMMYRLSAMSHDTFSADLFALDQRRCGLGEDTFLSRSVGQHGKLLYTFRAIVDHPNADTPKSYPHEAYKYAYAATYSRRFQNDHYRVKQPPTLMDRLDLLISYLGNIGLAWVLAARKRTAQSTAMARGTTMGAFHGLVRKPTAKILTPEIDWWAGAEIALANQQTIYPGA